MLTIFIRLYLNSRLKQGMEMYKNWHKFSSILKLIIVSAVKS